MNIGGDDTATQSGTNCQEQSQSVTNGRSAWWDGFVPMPLGGKWKEAE
jgi:hypothetical protein